MKTECPYCKSEMVKGFIHGGRYVFKWHEENAGLLEKVTVFGGETLHVNPQVSCYRCKNCDKIIINLKEL